MYVCMYVCIVKSFSSLPVHIHCPAPPTPTEVTAQVMNSSSIRISWQWTSSGPAPDCFNATFVTYCPEGGDESSLQLSGPAATVATLTDLQCNTNYTITVVATAGEHRREGIASILLQGITFLCICLSLHKSIYYGHFSITQILVSQLESELKLLLTTQVSECHGNGHVRTYLCVLTLLELTTNLREAL